MHKPLPPPRSTKPESYSVLVVDDEKSTLLVVSAAIRDAGFTVYEATDGQEGLALALARHPDMILLDIQMPVMDGISMLEELRKDLWGKDAFVMLLTHVSGTDKVAQALELGAFDYLDKSNWDLPAIVAQIKKRLRVV